MKRYHVNESGNPGICRAEKQCRFKLSDEEHYGSPADARKAYEDRMAQAEAPVSETSHAYVPLTQERILAMDEEAQRLVLGAINQNIYKKKGTMDEADYWQAVYDSTTAGQLWLQRKRGDRARPDPEYIKRSFHLEKFLNEDGQQIDLTPPAIPVMCSTLSSPARNRTFS